MRLIDITEERWSSSIIIYARIHHTDKEIPESVIESWIKELAWAFH